MEQEVVENINIEGVGEVSYGISCDTHFIEDFGYITEYGIIISADENSALRCTTAIVPNISDDKNFIIKIISLLISEQALPIHLNNIIEDLLS